MSKIATMASVATSAKSEMGPFTELAAGPRRVRSSPQKQTLDHDADGPDNQHQLREMLISAVAQPRLPNQAAGRLSPGALGALLGAHQVPEAVGGRGHLAGVEVEAARAQQIHGPPRSSAAFPGVESGGR